ncbi:MAG: YvcK family protein [Actinobacteria bacterium]|nr:YvcK family protein [Actinomycetota bacterium]
MVAIGGGHGQAVTLRAVKSWAGDLTAVVSVADDGGSSGRLRRELGILPPGDLRRCLSALADPDSLLAKVFEHRFDAGELAGHAVGNLVLAGLLSAASDPVAALEEAGRLLRIRGRVLPASTVAVVLTAELGSDSAVPQKGDVFTSSADGLSAPCRDAQVVKGQVAVMATGRIRRLMLQPKELPVPTEVLDAILGADQVVLGPGSLYTSVLAACSVPGVREALLRTSAMKIYVCNLRQQVPETSGYGWDDHVLALVDHGIIPDVVLCHPGALGHRGALNSHEQATARLRSWLHPDWDAADPGSRPSGLTQQGPADRGLAGSQPTHRSTGIRLVERQVALEGRAIHDPDLLGTALGELAGVDPGLIG